MVVLGVGEKQKQKRLLPKPLSHSRVCMSVIIPHAGRARQPLEQWIFLPSLPPAPGVLTRTRLTAVEENLTVHLPFYTPFA